MHYRRSQHRSSSLIGQRVSQPLMYQRVRLCANLLWFDLANESHLSRVVINSHGDKRGQHSHLLLAHHRLIPGLPK
jgi:hypothetical protein